MHWHLGDQRSTLDRAFSVLWSCDLPEHQPPDRLALCNQAEEALAKHLTALRQQQPHSLSSADIRYARDTVQVVVDELTDNALKHRTGGSISVELAATEASACVRVTNRIADNAVAPLLQTLSPLAAPGADLHQMLSERVHANAKRQHPDSAGLGCLMLMLDHRVSLSWRVEQALRQNTQAVTMAHFTWINGGNHGDQGRKLPGLARPG